MKSRFSYLIFIAGILISCSSKDSTTTLTELIKSTFKLSTNDKVEILGTTEESKTILLMKFKVNGLIFNVKLRKYDQGWQFEEKQDESGKWVLFSKILNQAELRDKIRQSQKEMVNIAEALANYVTDKTVFPKISGEYDNKSSIFHALYPQYIKSRPIKDSWGNNFLVYCGPAIDGHYGISGSVPDDFLIVSLGMDGLPDNWTYDPESPEAGLFGAEMDSDIDPNNDLIVFNGTFIRGPKV